MRTPIYAISLCTAVALSALGCASRQSLPLERARASYEAASLDPEVATKGQPELTEAGATLDRGDLLQRKGGSPAEVDHLGVTSETQVEMARAKAARRTADEQTSALNTARENVVAQAHERARTDLEIRLAELQARETERGLMVTLNDVLFETNRAELKPTAIRRLGDLVEVLQENPGRAVLVEGHADSTGTHGYNLDLSQRRADAVRAFLVQSGITPDRVVATGYGEGYPVASNATSTGRQQNRRVELVMLRPGEPARVGALIVH